MSGTRGAVRSGGHKFQLTTDTGNELNLNTANLVRVAVVARRA
jgi:hypothetical protein